MDMNNIVERMDCILCGNAAVLKTTNLSGYQRPLKFSVYHCPNCDCAFNFPRVSSSKIYDNIYKNSSIVPGYNRYWKYFNEVKQQNDPFSFLANSESTYWGVRQALKEIILDKKNNKILEVGSGMGYLTYSLRKNGYNAVGLDISENAIQLAKDSFGEFYICSDVFDYSIRNANKYDVVILTEVIEHVDDPIAFLGALHKLVKSGGRIIITTPNKSLYPKSTIWASDLPPVHLWWLSENTLSYLAGKIGMNVSFIDFSQFYKKHYKSIRPSEFSDIANLKPFFDENDMLIHYERSDISLLHRTIAKFVKFFPSIRSFVLRFLDSRFSGVIVCSKKGTVICALFTKS